MIRQSNRVAGCSGAAAGVILAAMAAFLPVNSLEIALRKLITGEDGRIWQVLTPMASATLWLLVRHYPELDGSALLAPPGQNPEICVFHGREGSVISVYTAEERVRAAFESFGLSPADFTWIHAPGYGLLKWLHAEATGGGESSGAHLVVNFGVENAYYDIKTEMVGYLLERPEPPPDPVVPDLSAVLHPPGDPAGTLGPLRDFLAGSPNVRAAWIFAVPPGADGTPSTGKYDLALVMVDPEDQSLLERVNLILKAVTPVETEWSAAFLLAPDETYRRMAAERAPFYAAPGFLAE